MQPTKLTIDLNAPGKRISEDLFGIFFEDINYAADGGLYAELIQNRSFEYQATEQSSWNPLSFWELTERGGARGGWAVESARPLHSNNPHYLVLEVETVGDGVGIANPGFDGIPLKGGETYDLSFFARQLYMNERWGSGAAIEGWPMPVIARLETENGEVLGEARLELIGRDWTRLTATIIPSRSEDAARFVLLGMAKGGIALDEISLFPRKTFRGRSNGLRADLAQAIADIQPKFIRFPGGCLVHGSGTNNFYRWQDTIGPIEQRRGQRNLWGYHQSVGLGYFEYFQFCEDIGAKPLPVVAAGVSCQNSDHTPGMGQECLPLEEMPAYIQDVLDLVEWANGPATSKWGAKRAEAGHSEPFGLEYLGIGNEDHITPGFEERFKMIYNAVKAKHPEITVIGTVGPAPSGPDYEEGWRLANELKVPIVDEHYYEKPGWFWENLRRYDAYDRSGSKVYLGEFAAHDEDRKAALRSALAEAAYMASLERNGDIVHLASYAPLLAKRGRTQWNPNLIYFTNTRVAPTINYHVQRLFALNSGDAYLPVTIGDKVENDAFVFSALRDTKSGDLILKFVNGSGISQPVQVVLEGGDSLRDQATCTVLTGDLGAVNDYESPETIMPETMTIAIGGTFDYELLPHSLTIIRIGGDNSRR